MFNTKKYQILLVIIFASQILDAQSNGSKDVRGSVTWIPSVSLSYHPNNFLKTVGVFIPKDSFAGGTIGFTFIASRYINEVPGDSIIFQSRDHELIILNEPLRDSMLITPRGRTFFMVLFHLRPVDIEFFHKKEISMITFNVGHTTIPIALNRRSRRTIKALME